MPAALGEPRGLAPKTTPCRPGLPMPRTPEPAPLVLAAETPSLLVLSAETPGPWVVRAGAPTCAAPVRGCPAACAAAFSSSFSRAAGCSPVVAIARLPFSSGRDCGPLARPPDRGRRQPCRVADPGARGTAGGAGTR